MALAVRKKDRATTEKSCISNYDRAGLNVLNELMQALAECSY